MQLKPRNSHLVHLWHTHPPGWHAEGLRVCDTKKQTISLISATLVCMFLGHRAKIDL